METLATTKPRKTWPLAPGALAHLGQIVALAASAGCTTAALPTPSVTEARAVFSEEHFCPAYRIEAGRVLSLGTPPMDVALDPERAAMWEWLQEQRASEIERHTVRVDGCGEHVVYACWDFEERIPGKGRADPIGASCLERDEMEGGETSALPRVSYDSMPR